MKTLGISGKYRDAAAALSIDGRIVAATSEDSLARVPHVGYATTGGAPLRAMGACLRAAGVGADELDEIVAVMDDGEAGGSAAVDVPEVLAAAAPRAQYRHISTTDADALQAAASAPEDCAVLVCSVEPPAIVYFGRDGGRLKRGVRLAGADRLVCAVHTVARALGARGDDSFTALDRLAAADPEFATLLGDAIAWNETSGASIDLGRVNDVIETARGQAGEDLASVGGHNVRLDAARRALAASVRSRVAHVLHAAALDVCRLNGVESLALGGSMFANAQLNTELQRLFAGNVPVAFVPEAAGRSLGAALAIAGDDRKGDGSRHVGRLESIAVGPAFSDNDVKRTLDNCRLDYVYEPDWRRLQDRTSKLLSQGKVVAWFQGPMAFGPRPLGSRSILCDPSLRYSRENMNEYLRQVPLDEPLPVAFAPASASESLPRATAAFREYDAAIDTTVRDRLRSALDGRQHVRVHGGAPGFGPELRELLDFHYARTRVPGLIETALCAAGEPAACTPRDAVRTVFSSAIDALIIGRFVLMKDYWLLRSDVGA